MTSIPPAEREAPGDSQAAGISLKERQRREREQLILRAAMELLLEKGYHETAMEEIAARVGISKGAIYLHFVSKEELLSALFERGARAFIAAQNDVLASTGSPREKVSEIVRLVYGNMGKRFQLMSVVAQNPELFRVIAVKREAIATLWEEPSARLAALVDEGKRRGEFDPELPTPLVVSLLWSLVSPHSYQRLVVRDGMAVEDVVDHLLRYFLRGISAGEATPAGREDV